MTRDDYKKSQAFKEAVKRIWIRLLIAMVIVASVIGWFFHDILATCRQPMVQASVGEFMGVSIVVYVAANMMLHWLTDGNHRR